MQFECVFLSRFYNRVNGVKPHNLLKNPMKPPIRLKPQLPIHVPSPKRIGQ